jgi:hypothetical protein
VSAGGCGSIHAATESLVPGMISKMCFDGWVGGWKEKQREGKRVSSFGLSDISKRLANVWLMARACFYDLFLPRLTPRVQLINLQLLQRRAPLRISPLIKRSASRPRWLRLAALPFLLAPPTNDPPINTTNTTDGEKK